MVADLPSYNSLGFQPIPFFCENHLIHQTPFTQVLMETTTFALRSSPTHSALCDTKFTLQEGMLSHEPNHTMGFSPASNPQTLPPLLALPTELKLKIFSYLTDDEYPALPCLRRTHSSFLHLIPKSHVRSSVSDDNLYRQLITIDMDYAYLLPPDHHPCFSCTEVLPPDAFSHPEPFFHYNNAQRYTYIHCCKDCSEDGEFSDRIAAVLGPMVPPNTPTDYDGLEMRF